MFVRRNLLNGDARVVFIVINGLLMLVAVGFFYNTFTEDRSAFDAAVWGSFAYAFPARGWSMALALSSAACVIGLVQPVMRKLLVAGTVAQVTQNLVLAYSAMYTGGTTVVGYYAFFFMTLHMWVGAEAILFRAGERA